MPSEAVISLLPARCEYHTANRVAFQYSSYVLSYSRLTGSRAEVQTCLESQDKGAVPGLAAFTLYPSGATVLQCGEPEFRCFRAL
jgi:hypothetical protein